MSDVVLPDSRLPNATGVVRIEFGEWGRINMVPIYCANCGHHGAYVPEENMTFAFWLCNPCADNWGEQFGTVVCSDEVFWERVKGEQLEKYGRYLTPEELQQVAGSTWGPLTKLLKESPLYGMSR